MNTYKDISQKRKQNGQYIYNEMFNLLSNQGNAH